VSQKMLSERKFKCKLLANVDNKIPFLDSMSVDVLSSVDLKGGEHVRMSGRGYPKASEENDVDSRVLDAVAVLDCELSASSRQLEHAIAEEEKARLVI
jgi:hypothetical protein